VCVCVNEVLISFFLYICSQYKINVFCGFAVIECLLKNVFV